MRCKCNRETLELTIFCHFKINGIIRRKGLQELLNKAIQFVRFPKAPTSVICHILMYVKMLVVEMFHNSMISYKQSHISLHFLLTITNGIKPITRPSFNLFYANLIKTEPSTWK